MLSDPRHIPDGASDAGKRLERGVLACPIAAVILAALNECGDFMRVKFEQLVEPALRRRFMRAAPLVLRREVEIEVAIVDHNVLLFGSWPSRTSARQRVASRTRMLMIEYLSSNIKMLPTSYICA